MNKYTLTCFILLSCALSAFAIYGYGSDRVLLREVRGLTFDKGHWTTTRRGYSVPQVRIILVLYKAISKAISNF
jgi:hypothetical protein